MTDLNYVQKKKRFFWPLKVGSNLKSLFLREPSFLFFSLIKTFNFHGKSCLI